MTLLEYLEKNDMTKSELSRISGVSLPCLYNYLGKRSNLSPKNVELLRALGIECSIRDHVKTGVNNRSEGFELFKYAFNAMLKEKSSDVFYCLNKKEIDYATNRLNEKKIAYYSYFKDYYWVIKYDKYADYSEVI